MRIAYVQFAPALADRETTIDRLRPLLDECREADLIVLPELCNSGYCFTDRRQAIGAAEPFERSRFVEFLAEHCRRRDCRIVSGLNERDGSALFNSAVFVGPDGPVGRYRKLHLFKDEKDIFEAGDLGLPVFDCGQTKIGMLICFDWMFPEAWRVLMLEGADIICHPANLVLPELAQRVVLELKDKVAERWSGDLGGQDDSQPETASSADPDTMSLARAALQELGMSVAEAEHALRDTSAEDTVQTLVRRALTRRP